MITGAGTNPAAVTGIEMVHQSRRYALMVAGHTLSERDQNLGIPSSITLRIETGDGAGTHTVTIADTRATDRTADYPIPKPVVDDLTFTLYTTTGTGDPDDSDTINVAPGDRSKSTGLTTLRIDELYTGPDSTALLNYQVLSGPGTLYLGEYDEPALTPTTSLITAKATAVFLYLNGGDSKVRVYVDGADPDEDGATITFSYTGTDRSSPGQQQQQQQGQQQQQQGLLTPSLSIATSGTGTTRTVTVTATSAAGTSVPGILVTLSSTGFSLTRAVHHWHAYSDYISEHTWGLYAFGNSPSSGIYTGNSNCYDRIDRTWHPFNFAIRCCGERRANR